VKGTCHDCAHLGRHVTASTFRFLLPSIDTFRAHHRVSTYATTKSQFDVCICGWHVLTLCLVTASLPLLTLDSDAPSSHGQVTHLPRSQSSISFNKSRTKYLRALCLHLRTHSLTGPSCSPIGDYPPKSIPMSCSRRQDPPYVSTRKYSADHDPFHMHG
jgi:hypothetical protein